MDNSEEDAGTATIASRRLEAREKELGTAEEALATVVSVRHAGEAPTAGDEVSDFDSMPSPGVSDVNTSTEAILDMIDEFVDGPTAERRVQYSSGESEPLLCKTLPSFSSTTHTSCTDSTGLVDVKHFTSNKVLQCAQEEQKASDVQYSESGPTQCTQNPTQNEDNLLYPSTISESETCKNRLLEVSATSSLPAEIELISSSANLTVESTENSENNVRTAKSVASSELSELLIDDSVESSSNDSSVSVNKPEVSTHSPLRRRLVRPAPSDRPPDCTVSSTVDSQTDVHNAEDKSGECITKDVSSSSDAVPVNVRPEEIRHIREVSLCQAETSVSPPKKIKLVRPKPINTSASNSKSIPDNETCQSTSSEKTSLPSSVSSIPGSLSTDFSNSSITNEHQKNIIVCTEQEPTNDAQDRSSLDILPKSLAFCSDSNQNKQQTTLDSVSNEELSSCNQLEIKINTPINMQPCVTESELNLCESKKTNIEWCPNDTAQSSRTSDASEQLDPKSTPEVVVSLESEKRVLPLKLSVQRSTDTISDNDSAQSSLPSTHTTEELELKSKLELVSPDMGKRVPPLKLSVQQSIDTISENEPQKKVPPLKLTVQTRESSTLDKDEEDRKVPPIKLSKSYESPIQDICEEKFAVVDLKVPPLRIQTHACEASQKNIFDMPHNERKVPPIRISTSSSDITSKISSDVDSEKKVPPIKISTQSFETVIDKQKKIQLIKFNTHEESLKVSSKGITEEQLEDLEKRVPPIKLVLGATTFESDSESKSDNPDDQSLPKPDKQLIDTDAKQIPKLTIKIQKPEEIKSPVPKLTIKPIKPPAEKQIPSIIKLNIKPIPKPAEKINDLHRKSSSSEISESEYSENDDATSTSDQTSASDQGPSEEVPKVTMKLSNEMPPTIPKLTIKGLQNCESDDQDKSSKLKLVIAQPEEEQVEKVRKLTIKNLSKTDQPLSPKLTIKPIKPPTETSSEAPIPKLVISTLESTVVKETAHVSKITIKPVTKNSPESPIKSKRSGDAANVDNFPSVTKIHIKPVIKPDNVETEPTDVKVPIVSKLNIKPVLKPSSENEGESNVDDIPKVMKINIKPLKPPEDSSKVKDCEDVNSSCSIEKVIPTVTKLNIKPIVKPDDEDKGDSENQSSETGNSSDDNADVPVVTKINIKPICKPSDMESMNFKEEKIPIVTKLNIKPILGSTESAPLSPRLVTKLNIKPVVNPNDLDHNSQSNECDQQVVKNPPLLMKINKRIISESSEKCNNIEKKIDHDPCNNIELLPDITKCVTVNCLQSTTTQNSIKDDIDSTTLNIGNHDVTKSSENKVEVSTSTLNESRSFTESESLKTTQISDGCESANDINKLTNSSKLSSFAEALSKHENTKAPHNYRLLKQLLEQDNSCHEKHSEQSKTFVGKDTKPSLEISVTIEENCQSGDGSESPSIVNEKDKTILANLIPNDIKVNQNIKTKLHCSHDISKDFTKPLEINTERVSSPCSGQDSPRIILKINKTDHGSSAQIITEERPESPKNIQEDSAGNLGETLSVKKTRRKQVLQATPKETLGKRLRSSKIVQNAEQSPAARRNVAKRQAAETIPSQNKQNEMTNLEAKRLRLGQILSNKSLTVTKVSSPSPQNRSLKQDVKSINHNLLNNENCSKNGNSQLHNILSNLQAKQIQVMPLNDIITTKKSPIFTDVRKDESLVPIANAAITEVSQNENSPFKVTELIINDNSESRDIVMVPEELSQDPLEVGTKTTPVTETDRLKDVETPTPRKRGRPRKLPVSDEAKPIALPTPALEERPQRSLRLSRERPAIIAKPRGRGRGRGGKHPVTPPAEVEPLVDTANKVFEKSQTPEELDPTSSRVKLPRMTEALDKMPSVCSTPLSSRRCSDSVDRLSAGSPELKLVQGPKVEEVLMRSPESTPRGGRGGRGSRGGRGRGIPKTPRARGRARGGGKGAMYMRETMGIYGRVCGPATTTVELFEEDAQMMEDNATPAKPSHLLDEDSQSSVKSSTNDSSKLKKFKFADLFDSNKVWTAADVKEYTWPTPESAEVECQVMMIQEQVAMFLNVKSFKRRYPELKRRTIVGEERGYLLSKGIVTEALCDLGITAVEASEILDIMLSDYPHKYEEYRTYQRDKQLAEIAAEENEPKPEIRDRIEMKVPEKVPEKQEPKVDPEKTRQDMAAAAMASAMEFNSRINSSRAPAVVDLQSLVIHRKRPTVLNPPIKVQPPGGFYPHALLPGQYQHGYRVYTSEQLRYFPLNTVLSAPPAPPSPLPSSSESDSDTSSSGDDAPAKRKKLTKTKRTSDDVKKEDDLDEKVDLCRICNLRLEANRRYTHERFLECSTCDSKYHPSCMDLNADTIRKCREYAWQCVECKCCATCSKKQDDEKMLFCDLCDRGFHIYCVGLPEVPTGRWHCVECAVCKSCGARDPCGPASVNPGPSTGVDAYGAMTPNAGPAEWHHQTKRGPGGHKVYSHSLCTPCARAYRIGRYCPLCDRSFVGPKGTMQLIICKLCDRQHHKDCVKQTVSNVNVLDYTCGECRRSGITSRSAAVRNAPRTIATLFMAKRRFNKYAHRQYMQSRLQAAQKETDVDPIDFEDECSEDITEVSDPLEGPAPDQESMDFGD